MYTACIMPTQPLATIHDGTIRIDQDQVAAAVIKVQKRIVSREIRALGHNAPVANPRQESVTAYAMGVASIPASWQTLIDRQAEVDRVFIIDGEEEHLLHTHVSLLYDANTQELTLQGSRYQ